MRQIFFVRPVSWSVATCYDLIVLPSISLAVMMFYIMTGGLYLNIIYHGI